MRQERLGLRKSLEFIRKKWVLDIIYYVHLKDRPYYSDIMNNLPEINTRSLTDRLIELEENGILRRNVQTGRPIRVSYELTEFGLGIYTLLIPLLAYFNAGTKENI